MKKPYECHECGAIFTVEPETDIGDEVSFCPYCSSELYTLDDDLLDDEDTWH